MALTIKQQAFVEAYLANGFNATQAAITAGYSEKTAHATGWENLRKPEIAKIVQRRLDDLTMSANEALIRLTQIGRGDLSKFLDLSIEEIKQREDAHLLKKFKQTIKTMGKEDNPIEIETIEIELYPADSAIAQILKEQHLRAGEATDIVEDASLTDDERATRIASILDRARARRDGHPDSDGGESP